MNKIFIIIVSYNGGKDLVRLVKSLFREKKEVKNTQIEIVIVDNRSDDGSIEELKNENYKSRIKIIENLQNLGFAAGCNIGTRYALSNKAKSILLLNQDTLVSQGFIRPLIDNKADIVSPIIKFRFNNQFFYDFGGKINWWWGRVKHEERHDVTMSRCHDGNNIDYVSGCAMRVKAEVFHKIGFFDEKFFLYFEDVDFCLRAKKAGLKIMVERNSIIIHNLREGKEKPFRQTFNLLHSNLFFINKWFKWYKRPFAYCYLFALYVKLMVGKFI